MFGQHQIYPKLPTVVFIKNLPELVPAFAKSPCRILFGIVTKCERLSRELLTPVLIGDGKTLYALATGWKIIPSSA